MFAEEDDASAEAFAVLILLRQYGGRMLVDDWYECSQLGNMPTQAYVAAVKLGALDPKPAERLGAFVQFASLRARYNLDIKGPLLVRSDATITSAEFEFYINSLSPSELDDFIRRSHL